MRRQTECHKSAVIHNQSDVSGVGESKGTIAEGQGILGNMHGEPYSFYFHQRFFAWRMPHNLALHL